MTETSGFLPEPSPKPYISKHRKLFGLNTELTKLNNFTEAFWNPKYKNKKNTLEIFPTCLLYGASGTGKTTSIQKIAFDNFDDSNFCWYSYNLESLLSKELGESSLNILRLFESAISDSRSNRRVLLHLDDIDSVLGSRLNNDEAEGVKRAAITFMRCIDLLNSEPENRVILIATTNIPQVIDSAVSRRFSLKILFEPNFSEVDFSKFIEPLVSASTNLNKISTDTLKRMYSSTQKSQITPFYVKKIFHELFLNDLDCNSILNEKDLLDVYHKHLNDWKKH